MIGSGIPRSQSNKPRPMTSSPVSPCQNRHNNDASERKFRCPARRNCPGGAARSAGCTPEPRRDMRSVSDPRRGGRVAEGARLESVFTGNRNVGSNPTPSARPFSNPFSGRPRCRFRSANFGFIGVESLNSDRPLASRNALHRAVVLRSFMLLRESTVPRVSMKSDVSMTVNSADFETHSLGRVRQKNSTFLVQILPRQQASAVSLRRFRFREKTAFGSLRQRQAGVRGACLGVSNSSVTLRHSRWRLGAPFVPAAEATLVKSERPIVGAHTIATMEISPWAVEGGLSTP